MGQVTGKISIFYAFLKGTNYVILNIKICINRYYIRSSWESPSEISPVQNIVLCAVVLDEWLKELAAITQEHAIMSLTNGLERKT